VTETMTGNIATNSVGVDNSRIIRAFGQEAHVLVSSEQTDDAFCMLRFSSPTGNVTPPHLHRRTDETFLIESGGAETALNKSTSTIDDNHGSGTEAFAHEIEIGFRKIFRLPDSTNGQRLAGFFE